MPEKVKRLRVLAGPNGSGKSTVVYHILSNYNCGYFVNADELHKDFAERQQVHLSRFGLTIANDVFDAYLNQQGKSWVEKAAREQKSIYLYFAGNSLLVADTVGDYDAAIAADFVRYQLLEQEQTFTFETVLSDARKIGFLEEATKKGFKIYLYFVCTKDAEINKARVANRVALGGHYVPPEKIESRYHASLQVLPRLIPYTHRCFLFDNSEEGAENDINLVASIEKGEKLTVHSDDVPFWVRAHVIEKLFDAV